MLCAVRLNLVVGAEAALTGSHGDSIEIGVITNQVCRLGQSLLSFGRDPASSTRAQANDGDPTSTPNGFVPLGLTCIGNQDERKVRNMDGVDFAERDDAFGSHRRSFDEECFVRDTGRIDGPLYLCEVSAELHDGKGALLA